MADDKPGDSLKSLFRRRHMEDLEHVQKKAFTRWINKWLEKVGDGVENLYVDLQDGTKLLTLLNLLTGVKLPCEKGKTIFHKKQNIRTVLNYITEEKNIRTDGIIVEDVVDGKSKLTLALVWVLVRSFEGVQNRRELLDWAQSVTKEYDGVCVSDFTLSWKDGRAMCAIINKHRPDLLDYKDCDANQPLYNLEMAFTVAERELGIIRLLDPEDVCVPHPPEKVITMYVSELRKSFPEVPLQLPDISPPIPPVSSEAYTSSFNALCEWISSKQNLVNRNLPATTEERQKLLETLKYIRDNEVKTKRKEKEELAVTEQKLISFQQKYKQTFALPQFIELEEVWSQFLQSLDSHVTALEKQQQTEADKKEQEKQVVRGHQRVNDKKQEELRQKIQSEFDLCRCSSPFRMTQVDGYKYKFGDSEIHRMVRTLESGTIMIRVGGGWETLEAFLLKYDPCRKSNVKMHHCQRKNTSTRSLSATDGYQESTLSLRKENNSRPKLNTKTEENNSVCNPRPRKITKQHAHGTYQHTRHKRNEEVSKLLKIFQASHSNIQSNETLLTRSQGSKIPIPTRLKV